MPTHDQRVAGRELRYRLTLLLLDARRPMTLRELLTALDRDGHCVPGRASKTVSDIIRSEIRRGRVERSARSTYVVRRIPPSTVRWMRRWLESRS